MGSLGTRRGTTIAVAATELHDNDSDGADDDSTHSGHLSRSKNKRLRRRFVGQMAER